VRHGEEVIMKAHLEALAKQHNNLHLYICYSQPTAQEVKGVDYHQAGRIDITLLRLTLPLKPHHFYVCGPKPMMETLVPELRAWGVPDHHIHYEAFGPASLTPQDKSRSALGEEATTAAALTVTFSQSGQTFPWTQTATSLLEFAEDHGITIHSGCRAGSCGSCMTPLEAGEVEYNQRPDADLKPGHCLLCISVPKTNLTLQA
jgi:ferredoxin-NADP reductase